MILDICRYRFKCPTFYNTPCLFSKKIDVCPLGKRIIIENLQSSCFNNVEEQPILKKISDIGLSDVELEYNICIKKYSAIGEGGKLIKVK